MPGEVGIRHQRANAQPTFCSLLDIPEWQPRDIDQPGRAFDILLHQVDEVRAACDELGCIVGGDLAHCIGHVGGAGVMKVDHSLPPVVPIACWIAATMFG